MGAGSDSFLLRVWPLYEAACEYLLVNSTLDEMRVMSEGDDMETTRAWLALMTKKAWHRLPSNALKENRKTWNVYCECRMDSK